MLSALRRFAKRRYGRLPQERRVRGFVGFRGVRRLQLRNLVPGARAVPIVLTRRSDQLKFRISGDSLDEEVADSVSRKHHDLYFPPVIEPESVRRVLDVGAHHGFYAVAATKEYPNATIVAVEPSADAAALLAKNVMVNRASDRVQIVEAAIGDHSGTAQLLHDGSGSWGHSLVAVDRRDGDELVRLETVFSLVGRELPDVVKCNAEGGEVSLVAGLRALDRRPRLLVLMVHPHLIDAEALREEVLNLGYEIDDALDGDHPVWICTGP